MDKCFILGTSSSQFFLQELIWIRQKIKHAFYPGKPKKKLLITLLIDIQASENTKLTCFLTIPAAKDVNCTLKQKLLRIYYQSPC